MLHEQWSETYSNRVVVHPPAYMMLQAANFVTLSTLRWVFCYALFASLRILTRLVKADKTKRRSKERMRPTVNTSSVILSLPFLLQTHMTISVAALILGLLFESLHSVNVVSTHKNDLMGPKRRKAQLYWGALRMSKMQEWSTSGSFFGPRRVRPMPSICEIGEE